MSEWGNENRRYPSTTVLGGVFDMSTRLPGVSAGFALLLAVPLMAHHSFSTEFDADQPIELTGGVTTIEWINPMSGSLSTSATTKAR